MTQEELVKTPMFRVIRQGLMRKYPWIKDVIVAFPEDLDKYERIWFVDAVIDPVLLDEMEDLGGMTWWLTGPSGEMWKRQASFLSIFFNNPTKADEISKHIEEDTRAIQKNRAVKDLTLPKIILISQFIALPPDKSTITNKDIHI